MSVDELCCFCSFNSIEERTVKRLKPNNISSYKQTDYGLQCCICKSCACQVCLLEIVSKFSKPVQERDRWCKEVNEYLHKGIYPKDFVGSCCELKVEQQKNRLHTSTVRNETRYDGHLYLPEFSLIIDSPFECVDVHGLGGSAILPPVWHCVFSHKASESFHLANVIPDGKDADLRDDQTPQVVTISLPWSTKLKVCCNRALF